MSHVDTFAANITNIACLKAAVEHLGGQLTNDKVYRWFGRSVGDYPIPEGFTVDELGKCIHRIRFPGIKYDIGVVRSKTSPNEFVMIADWWGPGAPLKDLVGRIKVEYMAQATLAWAKAMGYTNVQIARAKGGAQILVEQ